MSETERICRSVGIAITRVELHAAEYLERYGFKFLVDFGYGNAVAKAAAVHTNDLSVQPYRGR